MIYLTRLNGNKLMLNIDLIELMEETPDTVITLTTGKKLVVQENTRCIRDKIIKYRRCCQTQRKK
ncbi:MAG: flagellar FlbD family protein [Syntrophomonadaceae bacterium]|jgi:flagellar protein FlbD